MHLQFPLSVHSPLIRLLQFHLHKGAAENQSGSIIEGHIDTYDLRDLPDYDALSYAWGPPDTSKSINLNGEPFPVSENLFTALKRICLDQRKTGHPRKLWIDAVCINQHDNTEKSHQVMLMRDIFANASRVLAWIGLPDRLIILAFNTLERFAAEDGTSDASNTCRDLWNEVIERRMAIAQFIERPYFSRMWIVQEVVVAKKVTVLCGSLSMNFDCLQTAFRRITGSGFYQFTPMTASLSYMGDWRISFHERQGAPDSAEEIDIRPFEDSRNRCATNPRDRIYALRGITNEILESCIKVDYDDTIEKVYTDFSKKVLSLSPDLQILSAVNLRQKRDSNLKLPSYVPDWTQPKYGGGFLQRYYRFKPTHLFRAAGASKSRVNLVNDSDIISIEGLRLDTISRIIPIKTILNTTGDGAVSVNKSILRELIASITESGTYAFTLEPSWIAFFRTMTADRTAISPRISDKYRTQYFTAFSEWATHHSSGDLSSLPLSAWELVSKDIGHIIEDKDMFVTSQGYFGLSHEGCHEGDLVCILAGGEVPYVIRENKEDKSGKTYHFLCECYVHGVMDGEAVGGGEGGAFGSFMIS